VVNSPLDRGRQAAGQPARKRRGVYHRRRRTAPRHVFAALDLGTNNCRLLIARPTRDGFHVIDGFTRIVRLGEGMAFSGEMSEAAIDRALAALRIAEAALLSQHEHRPVPLTEIPT